MVSERAIAHGFETMIFREKYGDVYREKIALRNDGKSILVCNYRIELTQGEYTLVSLLVNKREWTSRKDITSETGLNASSIPVHVANINKKARSVSGRKLLEGNRSGDYRLSENI